MSDKIIDIFSKETVYKNSSPVPFQKQKKAYVPYEIGEGMQAHLKLNLPNGAEVLTNYM